MSTPVGGDTAAGRASPLAALLHRRPRLSTALGLGAVTAMVAFRSWQPVAHLAGAVPAITTGAGVAHALAGALIGRRLVDHARTRNALEAALLGALASVVAVLVFTPGFAWWVSHGSAHAPGGTSFLALVVTIGFFSYFAGGWLLLLVSALVAAALWAGAGDRVSDR